MGLCTGAVQLDCCRLEGGGPAKVTWLWGGRDPPHLHPGRQESQPRVCGAVQRTPQASTCRAEDPADARARVPGAGQTVLQGWRESGSSGQRPQGHRLPWPRARLKPFNRAAVGSGPPGCARRSHAEPSRKDLFKSEKLEVQLRPG